MGMKDKWHRKFPFFKVIEKGVYTYTKPVRWRRRKKKRKKKKKKEEGGPASTGLKRSNSERFDGSGSELVYAPRGRVSLLL